MLKITMEVINVAVILKERYENSLHHDNVIITITFIVNVIVDHRYCVREVTNECIRLPPKHRRIQKV